MGLQARQVVRLGPRRIVDQVKRLIGAAKADANPQIYPFVVIALETSMRMMEILSIQKQHIDLDRHVIYIPRAKADPRDQPITGGLADLLRSCVEAS